MLSPAGAVATKVGHLPQMTQERWFPQLVTMLRTFCWKKIQRYLFSLAQINILAYSYVYFSHSLSKCKPE
jgi:hypothetical protein